MGDPEIHRTVQDPGWLDLIAASERLATARDMDSVVAVLRETARRIAGADGIAVVLRDGGKCFYVAEDAVSPLWSGSRFPIEACISGWAMQNRETVAIPDVRLDPRIPQDAYSPTFVRSLVMVPIGAPESVAAIGAYWSRVGNQVAPVVARLESLARLATIAIENARLTASIKEADRQKAIALTAGRMGVWTLELGSGRFTTSETCRLNFGRNPAQPFTYAELREAVHPDDRKRVFTAIEQSIETGADYDVEYRIATPGGALRWIGIRAQPIHGTDGKATLMSGVSIDITDRKLSEDRLRQLADTLEQRVEERTDELLRTQEALRQSQKLEAMGQLTGGVAHDFNNLLTPIMGSLDVLKRRGVGTVREQRLIEGALESAERAKTLIQRLLAFARRQPLKPTPVDLAALLVEMGMLISTTVGPQVELVLELANDLPLAMADRNQIEMAVLNLAVNARDAMPEGGRLSISARVDHGGPMHPADLAEGEYIRVTISDTGVGMDEETRQRAVEPFYSTKGVGKGTGLGLSMVHGLASQLGGGLALTSAPGQGTSIQLWIPTSKEQAEQPRVRSALVRPMSPGVAVLVDDEGLVRAVTATMLADLGFEVLAAKSAAEALEILAANDGVSILVTDHLMPVMTGAELARAAKARWPQLAILVISGYADTLELPHDIVRLAKPFSQIDLGASVVGALQQVVHGEAPTMASIQD